MRPVLIALSAPSGCGKTTIAHAIMQRHPEILFSVSATSRPRRATEVDGKDYFFLPKEDFEQKIKNNELVEWELIYGNYYGTLKREIDRALGLGNSMLFDIDVNGALSIKRQYPNDSLLIFIEPPNLEELINRLKNRKTEDPETLRRRLDRVPMEMEKRRLFDMCVVNDDLERAVNEVDSLIARFVVAGTTVTDQIQG